LIDYFNADILSTSDYYAFGSGMSTRVIGGYRYSFNGKETDSETGLQDYGFRIYNPSLGKFLSIDPLAMDYPMLTPYQFASNIPVRYVDLDGLEAGDPMVWIWEGWRQYLDVGVNLFTFNFDLTFNKTSDLHQQTGSNGTKIMNQNIVENNTNFSYNGWDLFKKSYYPVNNVSIGTMPVPKISLNNTTTVQTVQTITTQVSPTTSFQKKVVTSSNGSTTTTSSSSTTVVLNSGVPVTASASTTTSSSSSSTNNTVNVEIGPKNANLFIKVTNSTNATTGNNKSTKTLEVRAQASVQTPSLWKQSFGVSFQGSLGVKL
jgi:RHS repeat-associated protein